MIFGAIISKTETWLPSHVYSQGILAYCDPEDYFNEYGFAMPTSNRILATVDVLTSENVYSGTNPVFLLTKDKKINIITRGHGRFIEVEVKKLKDTALVVPGVSQDSIHTAAIATELFRTGHFKDVESFIKVHRSSFNTNVKFVKYDTEDILKRLPEPTNLANALQSSVMQRNQFTRYGKN